MTDIEKAKNLLSESEYTCVLVNQDTVYTCEAKGVSPVVDLLLKKTQLSGFSAADKVVGKAVALLFALGGVTNVYAEILSEQALPVFFEHNIRYSYGKMTNYILNRDGTDSCPMEKAVADINKPEEALEAICKKIKELKKA